MFVCSGGLFVFCDEEVAKSVKLSLTRKNILFKICPPPTKSYNKRNFFTSPLPWILDYYSAPIRNNQRYSGYTRIYQNYQKNIKQKNCAKSNLKQLC